MLLGEPENHDAKFFAQFKSLPEVIFVTSFASSCAICAYVQDFCFSDVSVAVERFSVCAVSKH